jgi:hypothetical protein
MSKTGFSKFMDEGFLGSRHPGENRGPEIMQMPEEPGFRLSPE